MSTDSAKRHAVAKLADIPTGNCKIVRVPVHGREIEIGVFNVGGRLVAYRNVCPHAGAPVCQGRVCGTTLPGRVGEYVLAREGEILRCPWHGWEFDLLTGEHLVASGMKLRPYAVHTENLQALSVETEGETIWIVL